MLSNKRWDAAVDARSSAELDDLPIPDPNLFFGYPVTNQDSTKLRGIQRSATAQAFSVASLASILRSGVVATPTTFTELMAHNRNIDNPRPFFPEPFLDVDTADLVAFPFAIVEYKSNSSASSDSHSTYHQAANAASATLKMFEKLCLHPGEFQDIRKVPPVVAITTIGPEVRVWLAHSFIDSEGKVGHVRFYDAFHERLS
ncbi:hypothetical protein K402DRAFT_343095 [Aulographum hederae CBS 113979]|uniref:Uncharacterized protein n=1 Tax=Aulographum hederae CBS 113979 TaxID=1176131 RepID=A0A6G1GK21_9PEZI|nr:hypothetical protein K402DRAFT_343095 [Aulographum hederae CBS 113979]